MAKIRELESSVKQKHPKSKTSALLAERDQLQCAVSTQQQEINKLERKLREFVQKNTWREGLKVMANKDVGGRLRGAKAKNEDKGSITRVVSVEVTWTTNNATDKDITRTPSVIN